MSLIFQTCITVSIFLKKRDIKTCECKAIKAKPWLLKKSVISYFVERSTDWCSVKISFTHVRQLTKKESFCHYKYDIIF